MLRHTGADVGPGRDRKIAFPAAAFPERRFRRELSGNLRLVGNEIHEVVHMDDVACRENPQLAGLAPLIDNRAARQRVYREAEPSRKLVFGNQPDGEKHRVAVDLKFRPGNRAHLVVDFCHRDARDAVFSVNRNDGMRKMERNIIVVQALDDISREAVGERADFQHRLHFAAFQRHAPRHDQADVAGAENHDFLSGNISFHIDHALRRARRIDACGPRARNPYRAARALAAAHRQHDGLSFEFHDAARRIDGANGLVLPHFQDHRVDEDLDLWQVFHKIVTTLRVAGAGQFFFEMVQAEAVVNALLQNAACLAVALQHENFLRAVLLGAERRRKSRRAAANDDDVVHVAHFRAPPSFSSYI